MPTIKKSNIFNYLKSKFTNTSSDIKMNGTQSAGSSNLIARADHVHPTDTSRAAANHTHTKANITDFPSTMTPASHTHGNITNTGAIGSTANKPIITTTSGKLTTGSFGSSANTFCEGNDSRLSNARTPTSHAHGEISNSGTIGSAANKPIITTTNGELTTGSFGTDANTFAEGNHTHNYQEPIVTEHTSLHAKFQLYKFGNVVTLHVLDWTPAGVRDTYARIYGVSIPEGARPPQSILLPDAVVTGQHILIGSDGLIHQMVKSTAPEDYKFNGQVTWITE